ncbi:unnamed protein product [Malus baccata var. baccata]
MAVVYKCTTARRSFFCFREVSFDDKPDRRNLLRNVSTLPVFKKGLFACYSPSPYRKHMDARENSRSSIFLRLSLKLHVALSFLSNIGDQNKHIYYWDQNGFSNDDYLTLGVDHVPFFCRRTALQCYEDFMSSMDCFPFGIFVRQYDILAKAANILKKYQENKQTSFILAAKIGGIYWWYQAIAHPAELTAEFYNTGVRDGYDPVASLLSRHGAALHVPCLEMMDGDNPTSCLCSPEGLLQQTQGLLINNASLGCCFIWSVSKKRVHLIGRNTDEQFDRENSSFHLIVNHFFFCPFCPAYSSVCFSPAVWFRAEAVRSFTYFRMNDKIFSSENWSNFVPFVKKMSTILKAAKKPDFPVSLLNYLEEQPHCPIIFRQGHV